MTVVTQTPSNEFIGFLYVPVLLEYLLSPGTSFAFNVMVRSCCAYVGCVCKQGVLVTALLDFRIHECTDFIKADRIKELGTTKKKVALVFCSTSCFEAASGIAGVADLQRHMLEVFRATWVEREKRHCSRVLLDTFPGMPDIQSEGDVTLRVAISVIMASTFLCATSRDKDKVTVEIARVLSTARCWREFAWFVYIGRKTYSMAAVCTLLLGENRIRFHHDNEIFAENFEKIVMQVPFGAGTGSNYLGTLGSLLNLIWPRNSLLK